MKLRLAISGLLRMVWRPGIVICLGYSIAFTLSASVSYCVSIAAEVAATAFVEVLLCLLFGVVAISGISLTTPLCTFAPFVLCLLIAAAVSRCTFTTCGPLVVDMEDTPTSRKDCFLC
eukprot:TRINITY_DN14211_c0_g1_i1.p3 TRINITY_DN14211_c0_g1~~TRINITY_DN14211_c0_g1_i1.p3  ORF type:complete len:118 (-),score=4.98 TRINITY_DN14211_c0_g1_i1:1165-1518(-)